MAPVARGAYMIDLYKKCNIKMATQCKVRGFDEKGRLWGQEGIE